MITTLKAVCCPPGRPLIGRLTEQGIRVLPYYVYKTHEKSIWSKLAAVAGVLRACLEFRPDIIYLNESGCYRIVAFAARVLTIPIVAHVRIFGDAEALARIMPSPNILKALISISNAITNDIRSHPALNKIPVYTIYDGFAPRYMRGPDVGPVEPRIACVGRVVPIKGQDVLLAALKLLRERQTPVHCSIAGDGDALFRDLVEETGRSGMSSMIDWIGFSDDVLSLLRTVRVLVCPSHREPLGRVIFEAWDAGCIPVAFAGSGGAAEVIAASNGGILYLCQEAESLAEAILKALAMTPEERVEMVDRGRNWMAQNCSQRHYSDRITAILQAAAG